jgi:hypothetical protein
MSEHDSFPGLTDLAADLLAQDGHHALAEQVRPASLYLTGQQSDSGDVAVIAWAGDHQPADPPQLTQIHDALNIVAGAAAGWHFAHLHQR